MTKSFCERWPAQVALFVAAVLAACLPTLAQQQVALSTSGHSLRAIRAASTAADSAAKAETAAAQAAFNRAWPVFASPRCRNCHQAANLPGANMPPGNPKWSLPPASMKMVIQGETAGQFCRQLKDPAKNGHRTLAQIMEHVSSDDLVGWGWNPGDGRTLPPLSRPEFVAAMKSWVDNGAACPQ